MHKESFEEFYKSLDTLSLKIKNTNQDIEFKRNNIREVMDSFSQVMQKPTTIDSNLLKNNKELAEAALNSMDLLKDSTIHWQDTFMLLLEKQKFRDEFKDSFLVIIYGLVKAGKSSLGNFIAKHKLPEQEAHFFKYDKAGQRQKAAKLEELEEDSFATDNLECTDGIQGFKLSGMTWVDTPGLGTMTKENEALAKDYIDSADFIVYPVSSDAPARASDLDNIKDLFRKEKSITVLITKSDDYEEDEIDGECVNVLANKTDHNRTDQEAHTYQEVTSILSSDQKQLIGKILSVSTYTAQYGLDNEERSMFEGSNMPKFYQQMTDVMSNDSVELKIGQPHKRLKSFVNNDIIGNTENSQLTLNKSKLLLNEISLNIKDTVEKLEAIKEVIKGDLSQDIEFVVDKHYDGFTKSKYKRTMLNIEKEIVEILQNNMEASTKEILNSFSDSFEKIRIDLNSKEFEIKDKTKDFKYNDKKLKGGIGGALGGAAAAVGVALLFTNPAGWVLAGAIAAEIAAGAVGAYAGKKAGEAFSEEKTETKIVGDNKDEIITQLKNHLTKQANKLIDENIESLKTIYFEPLNIYVGSINNEIKILETKLKGIIE